MEAPAPIDSGGSHLHHWGCPLCHRDPQHQNPRIASCGHTYCLMCLRDVQVTADLFKYKATCNLCHADISDPQPLAFPPHRVLPPPAINADAHQAPQGPTIGDALAALHQQAADPRNYYASDFTSMHQQQQIQQHGSPHGITVHLGSLPSSDQVINTIESSPRATDVSEVREDIGISKKSLKDLAFHLKGDLERDDEARRFILRNGGRVSSGATKHTDYVVMGANARKTKAMKDYGGVLLDEAGFWELMNEKIGNVREQSLSLYEEDELAGKESKLKLELANLEKRTGDIKRKLEEIEEAKADIKRLKLEEAGLLEVSQYVGKPQV
jgi:hypothetical protein